MICGAKRPVVLVTSFNELVGNNLGQIFVYHGELTGGFEWYHMIRCLMQVCAEDKLSYMIHGYDRASGTVARWLNGAILC